MSEEIYAAYCRAREARPPEGRIMPYNWGELPDPLPGRWMLYSLMFNDYAQELANVVNGLTDRVARLAAWSDVVLPLSDDQKLAVNREFIDDLATNSLNLPYAIKGRFFFASAHLSHQANHVHLGKDWEDNLPPNEEIDQAAFDTYSRHWGRPYGKLKIALEKLGGAAYKAGTHGFRNAYNHRFPARVLFGVTNLVVRAAASGGGFQYRVGGLEPLDLPSIVDLLRLERDACYRAFDAFQALVREQQAAIRSDCSTSEA